MVPLTLTAVYNRAIYFNVILLLGLTDWLYTYFQPEQNAGNWLAAAAGAFIARFFVPNIPIKASVVGWFVGFILGCLFAPDVVASGGFWLFKRPESLHGVVALIGDLIVQLVAWGVRLSQKVGTGIYEKPGESFDEGLDKVEKVANVWGRIRPNVVSFISDFFTKKP